MNDDDERDTMRLIPIHYEEADVADTDVDEPTCPRAAPAPTDPAAVGGQRCPPFSLHDA